MKKICILGVNGFIGHHLSKRIIETTGWEVYGMDMSASRLADVVDHPRTFADLFTTFQRANFRIDQVIANLLSNALKYGRGAPVKVQVRGEEGYAAVSVIDRGIGTGLFSDKQLKHRGLTLTMNTRLPVSLSCTDRPFATCTVRAPLSPA